MEKIILFFLTFLVGFFVFNSIFVNAVSAKIIEVSRPVQLTTDNHHDRNPSFFIANDGTWWIFFARGRRLPAPPDPDDDKVSEGGGYDIAYLKSTDNGNTWIEGTLPNLTDLGTAHGAIWPAAFEDNTEKIWVFYTILGPTADVYYFTSTDNGTTWNGPTATGINSVASVTNHHMDAILAQDGTIWVIISMNYGGTSAVWAFNSTDASTWSGPTQVSDPSLSWTATPRIMQESDGTIRVTYFGPSGVYISSSSDNGITWTHRFVTASGDTDFDPALVKDSTGLYHLFWAPAYSIATPVNWHQWIMRTTSTDLTTWTTPKNVTAGGYENVKWWDYWSEPADTPEGLILFYSSLNDGTTWGDSNIFMLYVYWNSSYNHFEAIQPAIDAASSGDTINVSAGTYNETLVLPQGKSLTLLGAQANVDPRGGRTGLESILDGGSYSPGNYGITIHDTNGGDVVTINGFTIRNYEYGIYGHYNDAFIQNLTVSYNIFENNGDLTLPNASGWNHNGGAIRIDNVDHSTFSYNVIKNCERGIRLDDNSISGSDYNTIEYNLIHDLQQYGIGLYDYANNNIVRENVIYNCADRGIQLWKTNTGNKFFNNTIYNCANDGILLHNSNNAEIKDNKIYNSAFTNQTWSGDNTQNGGPASGFGYQPVHGGIAILGTSNNIVITGNDIHNNGVLASGWPEWNGRTNKSTSDGIWIDTSSSATVNNNKIYSNNEYGVENTNTGVSVNAENNWWGDATGPYHVKDNPRGQGDTVSDNVDFDPWYTDEAMTSQSGGASSISYISTWANTVKEALDWLYINTIRSVIAGRGLEISGNAIGLQTCSANQILKWSGTGWECREDVDTTYVNGTGLNLDTTTFSLNLNYIISQIGNWAADRSSYYTASQVNTLIQGNITQEATWRTNNDTALQSQIDVHTQNITDLERRAAHDAEGVDIYLHYGWNTFKLPWFVLKGTNQTRALDIADYKVETVLASLGGNFTYLAYYDGTEWQTYVPGNVTATSFIEFPTDATNADYDFHIYINSTTGARLSIGLAPK